MDDRFKFRVWLKNSQRMILDIHKDGDFNSFIANVNDRYILMQCTGLKDKNGKLVYEGDILKIPNGGYPKTNYIKQVVIWDRKRFIVAKPRKKPCSLKDMQHCKHCQSNPLRKEWFFQTGEPNFKSFYESKIIGNIYETPELLEE